MKKSDLIQKLKQLEGITQDERAYLINLVNTKKKYGLVWEDKPEEVEEQLRENLPVLKEVKEKAIINGEENPNHILIEGDNLHALTALTFTHEGRIDVIYIDPPYNTGSTDWKYNNDYVDKEDGFKHSKWLSFMNRRLRIAKKLLKPNGSLICTIDENEHVQLGLLLEEIFAEKEIVCVTIIHNPGGIQGKNFSYTHEYAYFLYPSTGTSISNIKRDDIDPVPLRDWGKESSKRTAAKNCFFPIYCKNGMVTGFGEVCPDNFHPSKSNILKSDGTLEIYPIDKNGVERKWRFSRQSIETIKDELICKNLKGENVIVRDKKDYRWKTVWDDTKYNANVYGTKLLGEILDTKFPFPKSLFAVKDCLKAILHDKLDATFLDFFAGSGTSLHATMLLNEEDMGKRKCILITNNQNNICEEVTYERNKRVIQGYTSTKGEQVSGLTSNNLRYYRNEYVSREYTLKNKRELTKLATELLCIKEDCYTECTKAIAGKKESWLSLFTNGKEQYLFVIYDDAKIEEGVEVLQKLIATKKPKQEVKVYVFSNGQYPYTEEFEDVLPHITLCALPDAIYKAYQNVLPKKKRAVVPELEEATPEESTDTENSLFDTSA